MKFWDTSALIPLIIEEPESEFRRQQFLADPEIIVWYGSTVEMESAICRREREESLQPDVAQLAREKLSLLSEHWAEVAATERVRQKAVRLLRSHPLRAADSLQLAAALVFWDDQPKGQSFLTGDLRLRHAAAREGFLI